MYALDKIYRDQMFLLTNPMTMVLVSITSQVLDTTHAGNDQRREKEVEIMGSSFQRHGWAEHVELAEHGADTAQPLK